MTAHVTIVADLIMAATIGACLGIAAALWMRP